MANDDTSRRTPDLDGRETMATTAKMPAEVLEAWERIVRADVAED